MDSRNYGPQFQPHEWADVQDEGVYFGKSMMRSPRVYEDEHQASPLTGRGPRLRTRTAMIPLENGWHARAQWLESVDRTHNLVHVGLAPPSREHDDEATRNAAVEDARDAYQIIKPFGSKRQTTASNPEELHEAINTLSRVPSPRVKTQRTHFEDVMEFDPASGGPSEDYKRIR